MLLTSRPPLAKRFQSTSSVWRTTHDANTPCRRVDISIHVLRVEDDVLDMLRRWVYVNFNPRPPCGGRPIIVFASLIVIQFQSTSSVWRTTRVQLIFDGKPAISIHVLRVEDDATRYDGHCRDLVFQSTSSVWRTTIQRIQSGRNAVISIHVLRVEDDPLANSCRSWCAVFQSTSSVWRTTIDEIQIEFNSLISIHVLRVEDDKAYCRYFASL